MEEKQIGLILYQPNKVTMAGYDFTALERDILYHIQKFIQNSVSYSDRVKNTLFGELWLTLSLKDMTSNTRQYRRVIEAAERLRVRFIRIQYINEKGQEALMTLPPINAIHHAKGSGTLEISITKMAATFLTSLTDGFTKYRLQTALSLRSKYSKRLYELCCRWRDKAGFQIPISSFRAMLILPEETYKNAKDLRVQVLEPARKELKERADVFFEYDFESNAPKKKGRPTFDTINFSVITRNEMPTDKNKTRLLQEGEQQKAYVFLDRFLKKILSPEAVYSFLDSLCLKDSEALSKAYKRFYQLEQEKKKNKKSTEDVKKLVLHILKVDYSWMSTAVLS